MRVCRRPPVERAVVLAPRATSRRALCSAGKRPKRDRRHRCGREREQEHRPIEPDLRLPGHALPRHVAGERDDAAVRHQASGGKPAAREHRTLDEQLPDDAAAAGADRRANRDFALADRRARQQHIGDVAAGDDEQEADRAEERIERAAELAHHPVDDGNDAEAETGRVVVRPLGGAPRADHVQLRFGLGGGHAGAEVGLERTRPAR